MKKFMSLILVVALLLPLANIKVLASDVIGPLELTEIEEIDKTQIRSYSVRYKGNLINYAVEEDELDYLLEKFSNENLISINSEIGYENDAIGKNTYKRPKDGSLTIDLFDESSSSYSYAFYFDKEKIYVFNPWVIATNNFNEKKYYNGWFKFKDENTYDELMTFLEDLYVEDIALADKKESDSQKNKIAIRDFKILYNGTTPFIINNPFHWGVCSYIREGESEPVYVFYYGLVNEPDYKLFGISETMEENNTVVLDNKERMLTVKDGGSVGVEYDTYFSLDYSYKIQVDVADDMTAKGIVLHYTRFGENTTNTKVVDMGEYIQTGKLPSKIFSVENNIKKEETTNKTEEEKDVASKQEEIKTEENKEAEKQQEENKTENQEEKNTENKETTDKTEVKKEEVTPNKEPEKDSVQKEENKEQEQIKEEEQETKTEEAEISAVEFLDVPKTHWAYYEIAEFSKRGIVLGYGNGYFGAGDSITYEHFGLLLERMFDYQTENNEKAAAKREDVIVSVVKALEWDVESADETIIERTFTDCDGLKAENRKYIAVAIEKGLVEGYGGRLFADSNLTRAETVTLLARAEKY